MKVKLIAISILCLGLTGIANAQSAAAGHKGHVAEPTSAWKELPTPPLYAGLGNSSFKISTSSEQAQAYFNQGLRLLHSFWEFEAYRAFKEAARLDPDAAMAQWGIAMALEHEAVMAEVRKAAMARANDLAKSASEHEQFYIRAMSKRLGDESDWQKKRDGYTRELEALLDRFPHDHDARAFLAMAKLSGYDEDKRPRDGTGYAQSLLQHILRESPDHAAAHHYSIHAFEASPHPERALASADALSKLAPRAGHMVHMPGHIYFRIGNYNRAYDSFVAAAHVDEAYMKEQGVTSAETWNYAHNLSYLIAACAESGRYKEGIAWAKKLNNTLDGRAAGKFYFALNPGSSLTRLHIRFGQWRNAANSPMQFGASEEKITDTARAYRTALTAYARGMAAIDSNKLQDAQTQAEALDAALWRLNPQSQPTSKADGDSAPEDPRFLLTILASASLDLRGNIASARGDTAEAVRLLEAATRKEREIGYGEPPVFSRPTTESLGYAYLRAKQWEKAREAFTASSKDRLNNGHALFGIAQSYALAGDIDAATQAHRKFLDAWSHADADLPQVVTSKAWIARHVHPE